MATVVTVVQVAATLAVAELAAATKAATSPAAEAVAELGAAVVTATKAKRIGSRSSRDNKGQYGRGREKARKGWRAESKERTTKRVSKDKMWVLWLEEAQTRCTTSCHVTA
jgi:hypothetical protein